MRATSTQHLRHASMAPVTADRFVRGPYVAVAKGLLTLVVVLLPFHPAILFFASKEVAYWKEFGIVLAFVLAMVGILARAFSPMPLRRSPLVFILLFALVVVIRALLRADTIGFFGMAGYLVYMVMFVAAAVILESTPVRRMLAMMVIPGVLVAVGGIVQVHVSTDLFGVVPVTFRLGETDLQRAGSFLASSIVLAPYLAMQIMLAVSLAVGTSSRASRLWWFACAAVMLYTLIQTWARGGWVQLAMSMVIFVWLLRRRGQAAAAGRKILRRLFWSTAAVAGVIAVLLALFEPQFDTEVLLQRAASIVDWESDGANVERANVWTAALEYIVGSPLTLVFGDGPGEGWAFGTMIDAPPSRYALAMEAQGLNPVTESYWLLVLLNVGIAGLALLVLLFYRLLRRGMRLLRRLTDPVEVAGVAGVLASLIAMVLALIWFQSLTSFAVAMVAWFQFSILTRDPNVEARGVHWMEHRAASQEPPSW